MPTHFPEPENIQNLFDYAELLAINHSRSAARRSYLPFLGIVSILSVWISVKMEKKSKPISSGHQWKPKHFKCTELTKTVQTEKHYATSLICLWRSQLFWILLFVSNLVFDTINDYFWASKRKMTFLQRNDDLAIFNEMHRGTNFVNITKHCRLVCLRFHWAIFC